MDMKTTLDCAKWATKLNPHNNYVGGFVILVIWLGEVLINIARIL